MNSSFNAYYAAKINQIIQSEIAEITNPIFVLLVDFGLFYSSLPQINIADLDTLVNENKHLTYNEAWCKQIIRILKTPKEYHLISYAQWCYIQELASSSVLDFQDRIIIIEDNLRQLFPLEQKDYVETADQENIDSRPENLPLHHIEQNKLQHKYYYSSSRPTGNYKVLPLFEEELDIEYNSSIKDDSAYNLSFDHYAVDLLINEQIQENKLNVALNIVYFKKQDQDFRLQRILKKWNAVLQSFGGRLQFISADTATVHTEIREETVRLLKKHWGEEADFRNISIYQSPDQSKEVVDISQGSIVNTIINAYEANLRNEKCRDVFLTAPTGAGKSLIFQLPAFHISALGDVTIVVSPLIALMKDQVESIVHDRRYTKVAYLNGELTLEEREQVIQHCQEGLIDIIYMSPELFLSYDISYFIRDRNLGLIAIDEAHLITTWGRDFRVDYWFLGEHIRKLREVDQLKFVIVAVTATAVFGGSDDMVFDSIRSLHLDNPHLYIGQVKREDITFVFQNYPSFEKKYEVRKQEQTILFSQETHSLQLKTLIYTPYTKQISSILESLDQKFSSIATGYHGGMISESKNFALEQFKSNNKKIMLCTKAFGMGVDIPDIDMVYHHAPSGLFSDYIQEVGRAARKPDLIGFATINYNPDDLIYAKTLHNMSAIQPYQLQAVLQKIQLAYLSNGHKRNLLLSAQDFEYIFDKSQDVQQKLLTSLMFLEKNYIQELGFPVFTARPQKRFITGFAKLNDENLSKLNDKYPGTFEIISSRKNGQHIIEIDLEHFWEEYGQEQNFEKIKLAYYNGTLFDKDGIKLEPQLKIVFERTRGFFNQEFSQLKFIFDVIQQALASFEGFFTSSQLENKLSKRLDDRKMAVKISNLLLSSHISTGYGSRNRGTNYFLQKRYIADEAKYLHNAEASKNTFSRLLTRFSHLYEHNTNRQTSRFCTKKNINSDSYVKLGNFLETLNLATFEIKGSDKTRVHIRINSPEHLALDSNAEAYRNTLHRQSFERQETSYALFNQFFQNTWSNQQRWEFIEDYFLGIPIIELLTPLSPTDENYTDLKIRLEKILEQEKGILLRSHDIVENTKAVVDSNLHIFLANKDDVLEQNKLLTIQSEDQTRTMRVSEWLMHDPVELDKERRRVDFKLEAQANQILNSKLRNNHFEYYRDRQRLQLYITFPKYDSLVKAILPYSDKPVEFYKWWCENPDQVTLSFKEKLILFDKVNIKRPKSLKSEHRKIILGK